MDQQLYHHTDSDQTFQSQLFALHPATDLGHHQLKARQKVCLTYMPRDETNNGCLITKAAAVS
jgi:hypothetical protein